VELEKAWLMFLLAAAVSQQDWLTVEMMPWQLCTGGLHAT